MYNFINFFRTDYLAIRDQYKKESKSSPTKDGASETEESKEIMINTMQAPLQDT
jgi:ABC-type transporter lipoprotein component MlaA